MTKKELSQPGCTLPLTAAAWRDLGFQLVERGFGQARCFVEWEGQQDEDVFEKELMMADYGSSAT